MEIAGAISHIPDSEARGFIPREDKISRGNAAHSTLLRTDVRSVVVKGGQRIQRLHREHGPRDSN